MTTTVVSKDANGRDSAFANDGSISTNGAVSAYQISTSGSPFGPYEAYVSQGGQAGILVSQSAGGAADNGGVRGTVLSGNGNVVVFDSAAKNLSALATTGGEQVYRVDGITGAPQVVSEVPNINGVAQVGRTNNFGAVTSEDGRYIAFTTGPGARGVTNLAGDVVQQAVVRDYGSSAPNQISLVSASSNGVRGNLASTVDSISGDAAAEVAFESASTTLGYLNGANTEVYVKNLMSNVLSIVSSTAGGTIASNNSSSSISGNASISNDGRFVAFQSNATNLDLRATSGTKEIYLKDLSSGTLTLISTAPSGTSAANSDCTAPVISSDGRYVEYTSTATNLAQGADADGRASQVYVYDTVSHHTSLLSGTNAVTTGNGPSTSGESFRFGGSDTGASGSAFVTGNNTAVFTSVAPSLTMDSANASEVVSGTTTPTLPTVAFDASAKFKTRQTAVLTGTYTNPLGTGQAINIQVYENGNLLGAATPAADGTWSFTYKFPNGDHGFFTAIATDQANDSSAAASANYSLSTGNSSGSLKAEVDLYDSNDDYVGYTKYNNNGSVNEVLKASTLKNGQYRNEYTAGSAVHAKGVSSYVDILKRNGDLVAETQNVLKAGGQSLDGSQGSTTFVFKQQFGSDTIAGFLADGSNHDTISLPTGEFSSFAQVLQGATQQGSDAIIQAPNGDKLTIKNIAVASLTSSDFKFHA